MKMFALLGAATLVVGAAFAQDVPTSPVPVQPAADTFNPEFEPINPRDSRPTYPQHALDQHISGLAHLCCVAQPDRSMRCLVGYEGPERAGFGAFSVGFVSRMRLTEASAAALRACSSHEFQVALVFRAEPVSVGFDPMVQAVRAQATDLCGAGSGPPPEPLVITAGPIVRR